MFRYRSGVVRNMDTVEHMSVWNDDTVRVLTELTDAGYSAAKIAHEFHVTHHIIGVTRNMIIGKRWRMNMPPGMSRGAAKRKRAGDIEAKMLPRAVRREAKEKREKKVMARAQRKLPGRLCFNMGFRGEWW
jgi:hypothetical protein